MKTILILVVFYGSSVSTTAIPYETTAACEAARTQMIPMLGNTPKSPITICTPSGGRDR
jgi:hypothetical protein